MKFSDLSLYLKKLEDTSSRLEITRLLSELFKVSDKKEIEKTVYLILGSLGPSYRNIVFNIAERMMIQILADAYKKDKEKVKEMYKKEGDLGSLAEMFSENRVGLLTVSEVYDFLLDIADEKGEKSQERKIKKTSLLLSKLDPLSSRYVARIFVGKLRLGFSDRTIIDALSWMEKGDKSLSKKLEKAYFVLPDVGGLAKAVKEKGIEGSVKDISPSIGVPVLPMLAQRLKSPKEMIEKMGTVSIEPKFDGLRIQIHFRSGKGGFIMAFTRNMNETSWMFPELKKIEKQILADEVILDTEAVGVDEKRKSLVNFQSTMTRRRKHDIERIAGKVSIKFYAFDVLYKNGKSLMNESYLQRREILEDIIKNGDVLKVVENRISDDFIVIEKEMKRELSEGLEGIIVKRANSRYVPGRTGWRWVKMKEGEKAKAKLADTLDCVVMGYYRGRGKRAEFGLGGFLVGVLDKGKFTSLTKIGTGLTDLQFRELKKRLSELESKTKPKEYGKVEKNLIPDVWVQPSLVVEIAADEITVSPTHSSGYALRFPRLVKLRDDKSKDQATTKKEIVRLFELYVNNLQLSGR